MVGEAVASSLGPSIIGTSPPHAGRSRPMSNPPKVEYKSLIRSASDVRAFASQRQNASDLPWTSESSTNQIT